MIPFEQEVETVTGRVHDFFSALIVPMGFLGTISNIFMVVFFLKKRKWTAPTDMLLLLFSSCILIAAAINVPLYLLVKNFFGHKWVELGFYLFRFIPISMLSISISQFILLIISVVQYFKICDPTQASVYCSYKNTLLSLLLVTIFLIPASLDILVHSVSTSAVQWFRQLPKWVIIMYDLKIIFLYVVPTIFILLLNWKIKKRISEIKIRKREKSFTKKQKTTTNMLIGLTKWASICALLIEICTSENGIDSIRTKFVHNILLDVFQVICFTFTMVPFIMYFKHSESFFHFAISIIKCRKPTRRNEKGRNTVEESTGQDQTIGLTSSIRESDQEIV